MRKLKKKISLCVMATTLAVAGFVITSPIEARAYNDGEEQGTCGYGEWVYDENGEPVLDENGMFKTIHITYTCYRDESGDWFYYTNEDETATVCGYVIGLNDTISKELIIPQTVNGRTVVAINGRMSCYKEVENEDGSIGLSSIGNSLIPEGVEHVVIPDTVKSVGDYTFSECKTVKSFSLPDSITSIGYAAFRDCISMESIELPVNLTSLGDYAFEYCTSLESIDLPNDLTSLGSSAFANCTSLKRISIPSCVTKIGSKSLDTAETDTRGDEGVFWNCSNELMIMIENSAYYEYNYPGYFFNVFNNGYGNKVVFYKDGADGKKMVYVYKDSTQESWAKANGYEVIYYPDLDDDENEEEKLIESEDGRWKYKLNDDNEIVLEQYVLKNPKETEIIIPDAIDGKKVVELDAVFENNKVITKVNIGNNVRIIGWYAFSGCTNLKEVILPDGLNVIGENAFEKCYSLENITIPESVQYILSGSFSDCSSLKSIFIPKNVKKLYGLEGCSGLEKITVDSDNQYYNDGNGSNGIFKTSNNNLIYGCKTTTIPNNTKRIADFAFSRSGITEITIPESIKDIGYCAFYGCSGLTEIIIPDKVTNIGDRAFEDCSCLENIVLPNSVKSMGSSIFSGCKNLKSINLPEGVTDIEGYAFSGCSSLTEIVIPDKVTNIGYGAFEGCSSLKSITIPDGVTNIGEEALKGCSELTSISIPKSVTQIGADAFADCDKLTEITVEKGSYAVTWAADNNYPVKVVGDTGSDNGQNNDNNSNGSGNNPNGNSNGAGNNPDGNSNDSGNNTGDNSNNSKNDNSNGNGSNTSDNSGNSNQGNKDNDSGNVTADEKKAPTNNAPKTDAQNNNNINQSTNQNNNVAGQTDNNSIQAEKQTPQPAGVGTLLTVDSLKATFKVTSADVANPTVAYAGTTSKKATAITIPDNITVDGISYKVTGIADKALSGNKKITKVTVGKNVTLIGKNAFQNCKNLKTITIKSASLKSVGKNALKGINKKATIKVPKKQHKAYKKLFSSKTGYKKSMKIKVK